MFLHENDLDFKKYIGLASAKFDRPEYFIEKDYWMDYAIRKLNETKGVVFRGSVLYYSKCDNFHRYPSDLDFSLNEKMYENIEDKNSVVREIYKNIYSNRVFLCPNEKNAIQWCWFLYDSLVYFHRHYFVVETYPSDTHFEKNHETYEWKSYFYRYCEQLSLEDAFLEKYETEKQYLLGEPFSQVFIDKILSLPYQLSPLHKKNKYRAPQTIIDIVSMAQTSEIISLLNDNSRFLEILSSRIKHDIIIEKERFGISFTEGKLNTNTLFSSLLDKTVEDLLQDYRQIVGIKRDYFKDFKGLIFDISSRGYKYEL